MEVVSKKRLICLYIISVLFFNIDARFKAFFTHTHDVKEQLLYLIRHETKAISFAMYYLTEKAIVEALKNAYHRGVCIRAIIDQESFNTGNNGKAEELVDAGLDILKFETAGMFRPLMHNKFFIFENTQLLGEQEYSAFVWTGSYNCTGRANKNYENVVVCDDQDLIDQYKDEFSCMCKKIEKHKQMIYVQKIFEAKKAIAK